MLWVSVDKGRRRKRATGSARSRSGDRPSNLSAVCGVGLLALKKIAHLLNAEGVTSPQPHKGRFSRSWSLSSVRHGLLNRKYSGTTVWNTRRKVRVAGTGKRVFRPRPESEWVTMDAPQTAHRVSENAKQRIWKPRVRNEWDRLRRVVANRRQSHQSESQPELTCD